LKIKICGVTDPMQAYEIALAGANAIGLVFAESPRQVALEQAKAIVKAIPPMVQSVGVFVNASVEEMQQAVFYAGIDLVQLHGEEPVDVCSALFPRVIKAARVRSLEDIEALRPYEPFVRAFLLDAWSKEAYGGTGKRFDWQLVQHALKMLKRPVMLAGGITPENCLQAAETGVWALDVSSGVEECPGKKDMSKVRLLLQRVFEFNKKVAAKSGTEPNCLEVYL
jgi:phosphoribosylanthranilate isomerase